MMSVYSATNAKTHTASESHFCQIRPRLVGCIPHGPRHHIVELSNGLFMDLETSKFVESHKPTVITVNRVDENPSENPNFIKAIVGFLVYTTGDGIIHSLDIKPVDIDGDEFDIGLSVPPPYALHKHRDVPRDRRFRSTEMSMFSWNGFPFESFGCHSPTLVVGLHSRI